MIRMIRVTKTDEGKRTRITIDGQLSRDYIEVVEICCNQAISQGKPVDVLLCRVPAIDETGRAFLSRLAGASGEETSAKCERNHE
jgi:hypothetical protein